MLALLTRRRNIQMEIAAMTPQTPAETAPGQTDDNVLMRFLTQGGATVKVYPTRFVTRWAGGPPFAAAEPYEINGFQWECEGCDAYGREGETYKDRNYRQKSEARDEANAHAEQCRALPKPTTD